MESHMSHQPRTTLPQMTSQRGTTPSFGSSWGGLHGVPSGPPLSLGEEQQPSTPTGCIPRMLRVLAVERNRVPDLSLLQLASPAECTEGHETTSCLSGSIPEYRLQSRGSWRDVLPAARALVLEWPSLVLGADEQWCS